MLTDVSQHTLRQGEIPVEWSDRVRTQLSTWATNSIQAEVMWPGLRPSAQHRESWAGFLSVYLFNFLSVCPGTQVCSGKHSSPVCSFSLSAQIRVIVGNVPAASVIYPHSTSWEHQHKEGIQMYPAQHMPNLFYICYSYKYSRTVPSNLFLSVIPPQPYQMSWSTPSLAASVMLHIQLVLMNGL